MDKVSISRRTALRAGGLAAGALVAPGIRGGAAQDDNVTITLWNPGTFDTEDPNDKSRKPEDFYIAQAIERFQAANPGVTVEMENIPSGTDMFTKFRTASVAQNGPDVMTMWSGTYMLSLKEFLEPMGPYFTGEERARIIGWEVTNEAFDPNSPDIYGVPNGSDGMTCVFANGAMLEAAGIDPAGDWRNDFASFTAMLQTVQDSGTTPLVLEQYSIVWQILLYWIGQTVGGSEGVGMLSRGELNFSDPELVQVVADWQQLYQYTIPGAETMDGDQALQFLLAEEASMFTSGFWSISDLTTAFGENLAMIKMPNHRATAPLIDGGIGGSGNAFIVPNYSEHKDESVAFIKFLMSAEEQTLKAEMGEGGLLNVTDVDTAAFYGPLKQTQQGWAGEPSVIFWADNVFDQELTTEIQAQSQLAWTSEISAEEFAQRIDAKRDEILAR